MSTRHGERLRLQLAVMAHKAAELAMGSAAVGCDNEGENMTGHSSTAYAASLVEQLKVAIGNEDPFAVAHAVLTIEYRQRSGAVQRVPFSQSKLDRAVDTLAEFTNWSRDQCRAVFIHTSKVIPVELELMLADDGAVAQAWLVHRDGRPVTLEDMKIADKCEPR